MKLNSGGDCVLVWKINIEVFVIVFIFNIFYFCLGNYFSIVDSYLVLMDNFINIVI